MRVASFDIGSNTVLMLVAERRGERWECVEDHAEICRISEGLDASGVLAAAPIERTRVAVRAMAQRAAELGVDRVVATGTAPFRRATNGAEAAATLAAAIGVEVDIVSGEREAVLSLRATQHAFPDAEAITVVDIGGASTEIVAASRTSHRMVSLDIGSVRLTERCVKAHPISTADRAALATVIDAELGREDVRGLFDADRPLVGIAGTVTTIATVHLGMDDYDADRVHGLKLPAAVVLDVHGRLSELSVDARAALPGCPRKRADVLPAGALLLSRILAAAGQDEVIVSDRGLRWGRLYEL